MASVVGAKGQVVIEKAIRNALEVRPGSIAIQRVVGNHVEISFMEPEHDRCLRGILAGATSHKVAAEAWPRLRERAWAEAAMREWSDEQVQEG